MGWVTDCRDKPMQTKHPLARRIVIAFTLMTLMVSGLFSLGIVAAVHFIEERLVSQELERELTILLQRNSSTQQPVFIDSITRFYSSRSTDNSLPTRYTGLREGFSEVVEEGDAYYVYTRDLNGERYQLVQQQNEFERREKTLFTAVLVGFLLSVLAAWILGKAMARKVMAPVSRLAQQVRHRDQLHPLSPPLAVDYPNDEVGHLAAAFDNALGQLRLSLSRERLFTSDVSHELRTPLMVIASSCELLETGQLDPRSRDQVERISRSAKEMKDLVQIFLMLARAESKEGVPEHAVSLATVAQQQFQHWQPLMRNKGLDFEAVEEQRNVERYNHTLLSTVMSNLLRNALHYTETGNVRLVMEAGGFRVEDTGIGVPVNQQSKIFEPFTRGVQVKGEGLGMGLSLVKRICEHQGWQISVTSLSAGGSCFRVSFTYL